MLLEVITQRIKTPEVEIVGSLKLQSYSPDGVEAVKDALRAGLKATENIAQVKYLGSGTFRVSVKSPDYKSAEKILDKFIKDSTSVMSKAQGSAEFTRAEG